MEKPATSILSLSAFFCLPVFPLTVFCLAIFCLALSQGRAAVTFDVRDFGAVANGTTLNTSAIQKAIDSCAKTGGGTVQFKTGSFLTGTLYLKSNVTLQIDEGATLLASGNYSHYPNDTYKCMYNGESYMDRAFIFAQGADNVGLTGKGTIDGSGKSFAALQRPMMIRFVSCTNVILKDLRLLNPASYTSMFHYCKNVTLDGLDIQARAQSNGDGADFDGCQNVLVANCSFNTSDDAVCLQTSKKEFPCRNIRVTNCRTTETRTAFMRIGLLSVGDFDSVEVDHCRLDKIQQAAFKIQICEGAKMSNFNFHDIELINSPRIAFMTLNSFRFSRLEVEAGRALPAIAANPFSNIRFSNFKLTNPGFSDVNSHIIVAGIPDHTLDNVEFSGISFVAPGGGSAAQAAKRNLGELAGKRPEPSVLGIPPAYGLYMHHARNISLRNSVFKTLGTDARAAVVGEDATEVKLIANRLQAGADSPGSQTTTPKNLAQGASVRASSGLGADAAKAVDGDLKTLWTSANTDNESYTVDLGAAYAIDRVVLFWNTDFGADYKIQVASAADTSKWTDVSVMKAGYGAINAQSFAPVTGRYVRMLGSLSGTQSGYALDEFEVYGNAADPSGLARKRPGARGPAASGPEAAREAYIVNGAKVSRGVAKTPALRR